MASSDSTQGLEQRLLEALRRTGPRLPHDMQQGFAELVSPANIAITAGVFAGWIASHAIGVGELFDLGLIGFGLITLGGMAIEVSKHLAAFLRIVAGAGSLDVAAEHLAEAVAILGVTLFTALVMHNAAKAGSRLRPRFVPPPALRFRGLTTEEWLYKISYRRVAPRPREGAELALRFMEEKPNLVSNGDIEGWLKGMDLSQAVQRTNVNAGETLVGYLQLKTEVLAQIKANPSQAKAIIGALKPSEVVVGRFFTRSGTSVRQLGIADQNRIFCRFKFNRSASALESTASPIKDTWTVRAGGRTTSKGTQWRNGQLVGGGGRQLLIPDARELSASNGFDIIEIGSRINLQP